MILRLTVIGGAEARRVDCGAKSPVEPRVRRMPDPSGPRRLVSDFGAAQISPIIFVSAKAEDSFSLPGQTQIRRDDGKDALFGHQRKNTRRNNVNARKGQRLQVPEDRTISSSSHRARTDGRRVDAARQRASSGMFPGPARPAWRAPGSLYEIAPCAADRWC